MVALLDKHNVKRAGGLPPHAAHLFRAGVVNSLDEVQLQNACIPLVIELTLANFAGLSANDAELQVYAKGYEAFGRVLIGLPLAIRDLAAGCLAILRRIVACAEGACSRAESVDGYEPVARVLAGRVARHIRLTRDARSA